MAEQVTVGFVGDPRRAVALLHPLRLRILEALGQPDSAAGLAQRLGLPRQRVNYHVRALARAGFLQSAGQRRKGNMIERRYLVSARGYVLSPELLGRLGADVRHVEDTFSASYLLALTAQSQAELVRATRQAHAEGKRLSTLSLSADLRFESPAQRATFAEALRQAVLDVIGRHAAPATLRDGGPGPGRPYRLILGCYPTASQGKEES